MNILIPLTKGEVQLDIHNRAQIDAFIRVKMVKTDVGFIELDLGPNEFRRLLDAMELTSRHVHKV